MTPCCKLRRVVFHILVSDSAAARPNSRVDVGSTEKSVHVLAASAIPRRSSLNGLNTPPPPPPPPPTRVNPSRLLSINRILNPIRDLCYLVVAGATHWFCSRLIVYHSLVRASHWFSSLPVFRLSRSPITELFRSISLSSLCPRAKPIALRITQCLFLNAKRTLHPDFYPLRACCLFPDPFSF